MTANPRSYHARSKKPFPTLHPRARLCFHTSFKDLAQLFSLTLGLGFSWALKVPSNHNILIFISFLPLTLS